MNDIVLHKIANSIVANLENTDNNGLINGKMGLCIFLYEYGRFYEKSNYLEIAGQLLSDIYMSNNDNIQHDIPEGYAGIGIGLCHLMEKGFVEGDADQVFAEIDSALTTKMPQWLRRDSLYDSRFFSAGIYMLHRIKCEPLRGKNDMIEPMLTCIAKFLDAECGKAGKCVHLLESINYVVTSLVHAMPEYKARIEELSTQLEHIIKTSKRTPLKEQVTSPEHVIAKLWEGFVFDNSEVIFSDTTLSDTAELLISQYPYKQDSINSELAIIGINLLKFKKMKKIKKFEVPSRSENTSENVAKGSLDNPYTMEEYEQLHDNNLWEGGYVEGVGMMANNYVVHNNSYYYNSDAVETVMLQFGRVTCNHDNFKCGAECNIEITKLSNGNERATLFIDVIGKTNRVYIGDAFYPVSYITDGNTFVRTIRIVNKDYLTFSDSLIVNTTIIGKGSEDEHGKLTLYFSVDVEFIGGVLMKKEFMAYLQ